MKRFTIVVFFLLLVVAVSYGQGGNPKIVINQPVFDAGQVIKTGPPIEHTFIIKNVGNANLNILEVKPG